MKRSFSLHKESIRTMKKRSTRKCRDIYIKKAFVWDQKNMRYTKRAQEIYMLRAWDLYELSMRST